MPGSDPRIVPEGNQSHALTQLPAGGRCFGRIPVDDGVADTAPKGGGAEGADPFVTGSGGRMDPLPKGGPGPGAFAPSGFLPCLPSPLPLCTCSRLSPPWGLPCRRPFRHLWRSVHVGDGAFAALPGEVGIYGFPLPILKTVIRHCYKGNWAGKCCRQSDNTINHAVLVLKNHLLMQQQVKYTSPSLIGHEAS